MMMTYNKIFTTRLLRLYLEIQSPYFFAQHFASSRSIKRSSFIFSCTNQVTELVSSKHQILLSRQHCRKGMFGQNYNVVLDTFISVECVPLGCFGKFYIS